MHLQITNAAFKILANCWLCSTVPLVGDTHANKYSCCSLQYLSSSHLMYTQCPSSAHLAQGHIFRKCVANANAPLMHTKYNIVSLPTQWQIALNIHVVPT